MSGNRGNYRHHLLGRAMRQPVRPDPVKRPPSGPNTVHTTANPLTADRDPVGYLYYAETISGPMPLLEKPALSRR